MTSLAVRIATVAELRQRQAAQRAAATDTAVQRYLHLAPVLRVTRGRYGSDDDGSAMVGAYMTREA